MGLAGKGLVGHIVDDDEVGVDRLDGGDGFVVAGGLTDGAYNGEADDGGDVRRGLVGGKGFPVREGGFGGLVGFAALDGGEAGGEATGGWRGGAWGRRCGGGGGFGIGGRRFLASRGEDCGEEECDEDGPGDRVAGRDFADRWCGWHAREYGHVERGGQINRS